MEKKIKRKRFNILKFLIVILFIYLIVVLVLKAIALPIKNIFIYDNSIIKDIEIIEKAKIDDYPAFYKTLSSTIEKRIKKIYLVKEVNVKKNYLKRSIEIYIIEKKILFNEEGNVYLEGGDILEENYYNAPSLINFVPEDIKEKLITKFSLLDSEVIYKISQIEYSPTSYDDERFILYMNDQNMVYITLSKISSFNKYMEIIKELEGHTGILYLDSGNYFEIKD